VCAWTQPSAVETAHGNQPRRLVFEPAVIQVLPKKYAHLAADPLASLSRAIEVGSAREVFMAAMLAPSDQREKVVELLIGSLWKAQLLQARATIGRMLTFLTDQRLGDDPKAWKAWWEGRPRAAAVAPARR